MIAKHTLSFLTMLLALIFIIQNSYAEYIFILDRPQNYNLSSWYENIYLQEDGYADFEIKLTFKEMKPNISLFLLSTPIIINSSHNFTNFTVTSDNKYVTFKEQVGYTGNFKNVNARIEINSNNSSLNWVVININYSASFYVTCTQHYECYFNSGTYFAGDKSSTFVKDVYLPIDYIPFIYDRGNPICDVNSCIVRFTEFADYPNQLTSIAYKKSGYEYEFQEELTKKSIIIGIVTGAFFGILASIISEFYGHIIILTFEERKQKKQLKKILFWVASITLLISIFIAGILVLYWSPI